MNLNDLALKYGTDKSTHVHGYCATYQDLIPDREAVRKVLEVGVWKGASLRMWAEWFPRPEAAIWGIEVDPFEYAFDDPRVHVLRGNVLDLDLEPLGWEFDLIVDDGSHRPGDVLGALMRLLPRLRPGGLYVIEDLFDDQPMPKLARTEVVRALQRIGLPYRVLNGLVVVK